MIDAENMNIIKIEELGKLKRETNERDKYILSILESRTHDKDDVESIVSGLFQYSFLLLKNVTLSRKNLIFT